MAERPRLYAEHLAALQLEAQLAAAAARRPAWLPRLLEAVVAACLLAIVALCARSLG